MGEEKSGKKKRESSLTILEEGAHRKGGFKGERLTKVERGVVYFLRVTLNTETEETLQAVTGKGSQRSWLNSLGAREKLS